MTPSILRKQEVMLLARTREVLNEILEILDLQGDRKSVSEYREALRDVREGRTRSYECFSKLSLEARRREFEE